MFLTGYAYAMYYAFNSDEALYIGTYKEQKR